MKDEVVYSKGRTHSLFSGAVIVNIKTKPQLMNVMFYKKLFIIPMSPSISSRSLTLVLLSYGTNLASLIVSLKMIRNL